SVRWLMPNRQEHQFVELTTQYSSSAPMRDVSSRKSKVAIVTGASSGIGLEAVKRLAANGYRVVANARHLTSALTLSETPDLKLVDGDISHPETARQVVSTAVQEFGRIDCLCNNACVFIPKPFSDYTAQDISQAIGTSLLGFFYVSQLAVSEMRIQRSGHVVAVTTSLVSQPVECLAASLANLTKG